MGYAEWVCSTRFAAALRGLRWGERCESEIVLWTGERPGIGNGGPAKRIPTADPPSRSQTMLNSLFVPYLLASRQGATRRAAPVWQPEWHFGYGVNGIRAADIPFQQPLPSENHT
jgi:hypothetical protein